MTTVFKALSDDTRRQILKLLANGDMTAKEISENFTISKPAISKHLDILKEARLVTSERTGMSVTYSLNATVLQTTLGAFLDFFDTSKVNGKEGNDDEMILSILVDTFFSRISLSMPPIPKSHNTACVLS